jgi:hypothetical protein
VLSNRDISSSTKLSLVKYDRMIARECCHVGPWEEKIALPINRFNKYVHRDGNLKLEKWVESIAL